MDLSSLYDSFSKLTINDTQSPQDAPKAEPYSTEARLWSEFSEILKKHHLEDVPVLFQPDKFQHISSERRGELSYKLFAPPPGASELERKNYKQLQKDLNEWVQEIKLCLKSRIIEPRNAHFFASIIQRYSIDPKDSMSAPVKKLLENIFSEKTNPPLLSKTKKLEERFYSKQDALEFCQQKIEFYTAHSQECRSSLLSLYASPEENKDQDALKKLGEKVVFAQNQLKKWISKKSHLRSKQYLKKPYHYSKMDEALGITYIHHQGCFGRGVRVAVMESSTISPTRSGHAFLAKALAKSSEIPTLEHTQHVIGTIAAPAKTVHERLGIAPLASISFVNNPADCIRHYQVNGKDYFFDECQCQHVEPEFDTIEGLRVLKKYTPIQVDPHESFLNPDQIAVTSYYPPENDKKLKREIEKLMKDGIEIISVSQHLSYGPKFLEALRKFAENGGVIVRAAGNSGHKLCYQMPEPIVKMKGKSEAFDGQGDQACADLGFLRMVKDDPLLFKSTIFVGNMQDESTLYHESCQAGEFADRYIGAWGTDILSTVQGPNIDYGLLKEGFSGTSMAAPMVAGVLAVLKGAWPQVKARELATILLETATPIGDRETFGMGRLNAEAAFEMAKKLYGPPKK